jgi:hypothetical protein
LHRQFAGRGKNQRTRTAALAALFSAAVGHEQLDERSPKRDGLSGTRASTSKDVTTSEDVRNGRGLNRERCNRTEFEQSGFDVTTQSEVAEGYAVDILRSGGHRLQAIEHDVVAGFVKRFFVARGIEVRVAAGRTFVSSETIVTRGTVIPCRTVVANGSRVTREAVGPRSAVVSDRATVITCWAVVAHGATVITSGAVVANGTRIPRKTVGSRGTVITSRTVITDGTGVPRRAVVASFVTGRANRTVKLALGIDVASFADGSTVAEGKLVSRSTVSAVRSRSSVITRGAIGAGGAVIANRTVVTRRASGSRRSSGRIRPTESALFLRRGFARIEVLSAASRGRGVSRHQNASWLVQIS